MEWKGLFLAVLSSLHPVVLRDIVFPFFFLPFIPQSLLMSGRGALEQRDWWERCEKLLGVVYRLAAFVHLAPQLGLSCNTRVAERILLGWLAAGNLSAHFFLKDFNL